MMAEGATPRHHDASFKRNLLDLEAVALQQIVASLEIEDRKNLALTCKALANVVRSQWNTLIINIYDDDVRVPSGLAQFRSLQTVVWTDGSNPPEAEIPSTEWEINPPLEIPNYKNLPELTNKQVERLRKINDLISKALEIPRPSSLDDLPDGPDEDDDAEVETHSGIMRRLAPITSYMRDMAQSMKSRVYEDASLAAQLEGIVNVEDLDDVFAPAPPDSSTDSDEMDDEDHEQQQPGNDGAGGSNNAGNTSSTSRTIKPRPPKVLPSGNPLRLVITAPLVFSGFDFQTVLYHTRFTLEAGAPSSFSSSRQGAGDGASGSIRRSVNETAARRGIDNLEGALESIWADAHPLPLPYTEIDLGWFKSDGSLPMLTSRGTATWCVHSNVFIKNPNQFQQLRELRICVKNCEADMEETAVAFSQHVLPYLTSTMMPALRELHLGRSFSFGQHLDFNPSRLDLPQLTKLVLNEMVCFSEFDQFTHLKSLKTLAIGMPAAGFEAQPQDLSSLCNLRDLRSLRVEFWQVENPQDVAALQQLTELELEKMEGRVHFLKPSRPMPNLAGVTMTKTPHHQDLRYKEDSKFARWTLRHAAQVFPGVEVLHLGTLGSAPASVGTESDLTHAASVVDMHVRNLLAAGGNADLQYLQLDTVLNISDDALDKRCETGSVELYATIEVPVVSAEALPPPATPPVAMVAAQSPAPAAAGQGGGDGGGENGEGAQNEAAAVTGQGTPQGQQQQQNNDDEDDDDDEEMDEATKAAILEAASTGLVVLWERTVEFVTCDLTDVLVAEFHYSRVVG